LNAVVGLWWADPVAALFIAAVAAGRGAKAGAARVVPTAAASN